MKTASYILTITLAGTILGCTLVDPSASDSGPSLSEEEVILANAPQQTPPGGELSSILHGGDERTWRPIAFTIMGIGGFLDCRLDDNIVLRSNGSYEFNGGSNLCGGIDTPTADGTWTTSDDGNNLVFSLGNDQFVAEVKGAAPDTIALQSTFQSLPIQGIYVALP